MSAPIAVSGATGHIGGHVARLLDEQDLPVRLLVRDPASPRMPVLRNRPEVATASFADPDAVAEALAGTEVFLFVSAAETADREAQQLAVVDAAARAGVRHIVYTSFLGAAPDAVFTLSRTHYATEQRIRESGLGFTFLRDSFYLDVLPEFAGEQGIIRGPAGDGRVSAVARADVARSAAAILSDPSAHLGRTYELTGPAAISLAEAAATITEVTGRPTRYLDETPQQARESRAPWNPPEWQMQAWISTYAAIASGEVSAVTGDVEALTGRPPLSLEQFLTG
ncbi:SDR family oxidoreductase [Dermacoccaceae bacterium W4C1]